MQLCISCCSRVCIFEMLGCQVLRIAGVPTSAQAAEASIDSLRGLLPASHALRQSLSKQQGSQAGDVICCGACASAAVRSALYDARRSCAALVDGHAHQMSLMWVDEPDPT